MAASRGANAHRISVPSRMMEEGVQRRIQQLLEKLQRPGLSVVLFRTIRALEALKQIGTPEAQQVLQALADI